MGFFFRKSIKLGLFRINLSKSGIGASVGVKGLRVGRNAKGQNYVSAGRGGVNFRATSPSKPRRPVIANQRTDANHFVLLAIRNREIFTLLAKTDLLDALLGAGEKIKYFQTYQAMLMEASGVLSRLHPEGVETLLLNRLLLCYERGHETAFSSGQDFSDAVQFFEAARMCKKLLRGTLRNTLDAEEQKIVSDLYAQAFPPVPEPSAAFQAGQKVGRVGLPMTILIILVGLVSWCSTSLKPTPRASTENSLSVTSTAMPSPSPTLLPKKKRR